MWPALIGVCPLIILCILLAFKILTWDSIVSAVQRNVKDDPASLWGLVIAIYVLVVAIGAKRAAEEARELGRQRNLIEELESASKAVQEIGIFLMTDQWGVVHVKAMELQSSCKTAAVRWPDQMSVDRRDDMLTAGLLVASIAKEASYSAISPLTKGKRKMISDVHLRANDLISGALADARKQQERST